MFDEPTYRVDEHDETTDASAPHTRLLRQSSAEIMEPRTTDTFQPMPRQVRFVMDDLTAVLDVPARQYLVLGRKVVQEDNQVDVDFGVFRGQEQGVSRYHAILQLTDNRITIKDCNSSNGTFLNGLALRPLYGYPVKQGDAIRLGHLNMRIFFLD